MDKPAKKRPHLIMRMCYKKSNTMPYVKNCNKLISSVLILTFLFGCTFCQFQMDDGLKRFLGTLEPYEQTQNEVVFVLDESGSIGEENFPQVKQFTALVARQLSVSYNFSRITVITFSSWTRLHINYIDGEGTGNMCTFVKEVEKIDYAGGNTHTSEAMDEAWKRYSNSWKGANRILILVTDGQSNNGYSPNHIASEMKKDGIIIFAVGVAEVNEAELEAVATSSSHIYILSSFLDIYNINLFLRESFVEVQWDVAESSLCDHTCTGVPEGYGCCDVNGGCFCGSKGGNYQCVCKPGFTGNGNRGECDPCKKGTFKSTHGVHACTPCPEFSTTKYIAHESITDCECIRGYVGHPGNGEKCRAIECPKLRAPDGGILLPSDCGSIYDSQCSFRCNEGYCVYNCSLLRFGANDILPWYVPSEPRVCLESGTWSGRDFACDKIVCPPLKQPENGGHNCRGPLQDFGFRTTCKLRCNKGFRLSGDNKRICTMSGVWSGQETKCSAAQCKKLETNSRLKLDPKSCGETDLYVNTICKYYCIQGFRLVSHNTNGTDIGIRECQADGKWSKMGEKVVCVDDEPPHITCPKSFYVPTDLYSSTTSVDWERLTATDNVFVKEIKAIQPRDLYRPPYRFSLGVTKVEYEATDSSGLKDTCSFTVTVVDLEAPRVRFCPADIEKTESSKEPIAVTWEEPHFVDNSGKIARVSQNHYSGSYFTMGPSTLVTYKAEDPSGNIASCSFFIKIRLYPCAFMEPPANGFVTCDVRFEGVLCKVYCNGGHRFVESPEDVYFCLKRKNQWGKPPVLQSNSSFGLEFNSSFGLESNYSLDSVKLPWPDCAKTDPAVGMNVTFDLKFSVTNCMKSGPELEKKKEIFIEYLKNSTKICLTKQGCEPKDVTIACGQSKNPKIRTKREIDFSYDDLLKMHSAQHNILRRNSDQILQISFNFEVTQEELAEMYNSTCEDCDDPIVDAVEEKSKQLKDYWTNAITEVFSESSPVAQDFNYSILKICNKGQILIDNICVKCPVGTFFDEESETCLECPIGFYQDAEGTFVCTVCPNDTFTIQARSKTIGDCKVVCQPGSFSPTGYQPCSPCAEGFYQPDTRQIHCLPCPKEEETSINASAHIHEYCPEVCPPGSFSHTGIHPCSHCPLGLYQPDVQQTSCIPCPNGTTRKEGAHIDEYCTVVDFCQELSPCYEGSLCINHQHTYECICAEGRIGQNCEIDVDDCAEGLCLNGGTCVDQLNNFICMCLSGFTGTLCEVNINDCVPGICKNEGICSDLVNDYKCVCPKGFAGKHCELNINDCLPNPCLNGGTCFDMQDNFRCCCPEGFTGRKCDSIQNNCKEDACFNGGTCISRIDGFDCSCSMGFSGSFCEIDIDDCQPDYCLNGGTCVDEVNKALCKCPPFYAGPRCDQEVNANFEVLFPSPVTSNYILFQNDKNLRSVTVAFFMKTMSADSDNQGTPVSYNYLDVDTGLVEDNAFTLTDPSQLVLYIHGRSFHTKYKANKDFRWHHYAITWDNFKGDWALYVDAKVFANGTSVGQQKYLQPGVFVIGQEQDSVGGGFSTNEAFVGSITQFNVWDYALSDAEIEDLSLACNFAGNLISWPYAKVHGHGDLIFSNSSTWCLSIGVCSDDKCHCNTVTTSGDNSELCKQAVSSCTPNPCSNIQNCSDSAKGSFCDCKSGFDGRKCEYDINECLLNNGNCSHVCQNTMGSYHCLCPSGMMLMTNSLTCRDRYCKNDNQIYLDGEKWISSCRECQCNTGEIACLDMQCDIIACKENETKISLPGSCCDQCVAMSPLCSVWHNNNTIVAFDATMHEFEANCHFFLMEDYFSRSFSVQLEPVAGESIGNIILHINCLTVSISAQGDVSLNGKHVSFPFKNNDVSIELLTSELVVWGQQGFVLRRKGSGQITMSVPQHLQGRLCGLCGSYNGDSSYVKMAMHCFRGSTTSDSENWKTNNTYSLETWDKCDIISHSEADAIFRDIRIMIAALLFIKFF